MPEMNLRQALAKGLREALDTNDNVFLIGEDIGMHGGPYAVTKDLFKDYGPEKIMDTPISESGFVGAAIGSSMVGMKPIVEIMTINFSLLAIDQIVNHAAKMHYMSDGQLSVPIIIRTVTGAGGRLAATHSQSFEGWYASVPGLKVVAPSNPNDALGLLRSSVNDNNPIIFVEHSMLYGVNGEVPDQYYETPIGIPKIIESGEDLTIIAWSGMIPVAQDVSSKLKEKNIECEIIDLRTLNPIDFELIFNSVKKTNKVVILDEYWETGSFGAYISSVIQENCFDDLDAPISVVNSMNIPMPYSADLEDQVVPNTERVLKRINDLIGL